MDFVKSPLKKTTKNARVFTVPFEHNEFNRLTFGLSNSPTNFQRLMDVVLKNLVGTECFVFLDDIFSSESAEQHALRL